MDVLRAAVTLLRMDTGRIARGLKSRWMDKTFPHGVDYRDEMSGFDRLYLVRDPWSLNCESERFRFRETNKVIAENFGYLDSLLEIGCGEGLQSRELQQVSQSLYGIDVSGRAIRRARRRCPDATFAISDMYDLPQSLPATAIRSRNGLRGSLLYDGR